MRIVHGRVSVRLFNSHCSYERRRRRRRRRLCDAVARVTARTQLARAVVSSADRRRQWRRDRRHARTPIRRHDRGSRTRRFFYFFGGIARRFVRAPATGALDATTGSRCRTWRRRRRRRTGRPGLGHRPKPGAGAQGRPTVQAVPVPVGGSPAQVQGRTAEQGGDGHVGQQVSPPDRGPSSILRVRRRSRRFTDGKTCKCLTV